MENQTTAPEIQPRRRNVFSRRGAIIATTVGLATGGFAGGFLVSHAASPTPAPSSTSTGSGTTTTPSTTTPASGTFTPNEDATHEAGESAAREAQETAGQAPTIP